MSELLFIAAVCTYLWPGTDDTTYQLCYELVALSDKSQLTHEANIGNLFSRRLIDSYPDRNDRARPDIEIAYILPNRRLWRVNASP
jgi:hypothetical protein